jgi:hypothetical protein
LHPPAVLYLWRHSNRAVAGLCNFKGAIASNTLRYLRQKPYHMKIVTKMLGDEVYEAVTKDGIPVIIDMRPLPEKQNQSPVELLLSSLSACGAVDIVSMLKKRKKNHRFIYHRNRRHTKRRNTPVIYGYPLSIHYCIR